MGVKLLILLALLVGVLYCLHLLVQDYQALMAGPRLLRLLFKREIDVMNSSTRTSKHTVRWRMILQHDPIQCARYLFCELGAHNYNSELQQGLIYMLTVEPKEEDSSARDVFVAAYHQGHGNNNKDDCRNKYPYCPFDHKLLFELIEYLLRK